MFKEKPVFNDLPVQQQCEEIERNACNAAFYALGLRWYWDIDTYQRLVRSGLACAEQIRHYLETQQPHLLKAYDADFLVGAILEKKARHQARSPQPASAPRHFDWAQTLCGELGA